MPERRQVLEWCIAGQPFAGEERSGDDALVVAGADDALVAAVDGVGHGPEAVRAAECALAAVRDGPRRDVVALARRCHEALLPTRGAAVAFAVFHGGTVTWLGVGNVAGRLLGAGAVPATGHWLPSLSGVAGDELPPLRPATLPLRRGDVLIMATDGIDPAFADHAVASGPCEEIAGRVLRDHARAADDALVVVARYLREGAA